MRTTPHPAKAEVVEEVSALISQSKGVVFTEYRGLNMKDLTALRRQLAAVNTEYKVVKNTLYKRAAKPHMDIDFGNILEGPTAYAFLHGDEAAGAKALTDFAKTNKALVIKGAVISGRLYDAAAVAELAKLPSRDVLVAQVVGGIQAPISGFVNTLQGILRDFVYTVQAVADKKAEAA